MAAQFGQFAFVPSPQIVFYSTSESILAVFSPSYTFSPEWLDLSAKDYDSTELYVNAYRAVNTHCLGYKNRSVDV